MAVTGSKYDEVLSYEDCRICQAACGLIERSNQKHVCKSGKVSINKSTEYIRHTKQVLPNTLKQSMGLGIATVVMCFEDIISPCTEMCSFA